MSAKKYPDPVECACPVARHEHGTIAMYSRDKCRCEPCMKAKAAQRVRLTNPVHNVSGVPARAHLKKFLAAGFTIQDIARSNHVHANTLYRILKTRYITVSPATLEMVMNLKVSDVSKVSPTSKNARVSGDIARAKMQELHACGWTVEDISEVSHVRIQNLYRILRGFKTTAEVNASIDAAYKKLRYQEPPTQTPLQRARVLRARTRAQANNWDGMMLELAA